MSDKKKREVLEPLGLSSWDLPPGTSPWDLPLDPLLTLKFQAHVAPIS